MSWLKEVIGTEKAIVAMCHFRAMPGDPDYDAEKGMQYVVDCARHDLIAVSYTHLDVYKRQRLSTVSSFHRASFFRCAI